MTDTSAKHQQDQITIMKTFASTGKMDTSVKAGGSGGTKSGGGSSGTSKSSSGSGAGNAPTVTYQEDSKGRQLIGGQYFDEGSQKWVVEDKAAARQYNDYISQQKTQNADIIAQNASERSAYNTGISKSVLVGSTQGFIGLKGGALQGSATLGGKMGITAGSIGKIGGDKTTYKSGPDTITTGPTIATTSPYGLAGDEARKVGIDLTAYSKTSGGNIVGQLDQLAADTKDPSLTSAQQQDAYNQYQVLKSTYDQDQLLLGTFVTKGDDGKSYMDLKAALNYGVDPKILVRNGYSVNDVALQSIGVKYLDAYGKVDAAGIKSKYGENMGNAILISLGEHPYTSAESLALSSEAGKALWTHPAHIAMANESVGQGLWTKGWWSGKYGQGLNILGMGPDNGWAGKVSHATGGFVDVGSLIPTLGIGRDWGTYGSKSLLVANPITQPFRAQILEGNEGWGAWGMSALQIGGYLAMPTIGRGMEFVGKGIGRGLGRVGAGFAERAPSLSRVLGKGTSAIGEGIGKVGEFGKVMAKPLTVPIRTISKPLAEVIESPAYKLGGTKTIGFMERADWIGTNKVTQAAAARLAAQSKLAGTKEGLGIEEPKLTKSQIKEANKVTKAAAKEASKRAKSLAKSQATYMNPKIIGKAGGPYANPRTPGWPGTPYETSPYSAGRSLESLMEEYSGETIPSGVGDTATGAERRGFQSGAKSFLTSPSESVTFKPEEYQFGSKPTTDIQGGTRVWSRKSISKVPMREPAFRAQMFGRDIKLYPPDPTMLNSGPGLPTMTIERPSIPGLSSESGYGLSGFSSRVSPVYSDLSRGFSGEGSDISGMGNLGEFSGGSETFTPYSELEGMPISGEVENYLQDNPLAKLVTITKPAPAIPGLTPDWMRPLRPNWTEPLKSPVIYPYSPSAATRVLRNPYGSTIQLFESSQYPDQALSPDEETLLEAKESGKTAVVLATRTGTNTGEDTVTEVRTPAPDETPIIPIIPPYIPPPVDDVPPPEEPTEEKYPVDNPFIPIIPLGGDVPGGGGVTGPSQPGKFMSGIWAIPELNIHMPDPFGMEPGGTVHRVAKAKRLAYGAKAVGTTGKSPLGKRRLPPPQVMRVRNPGGAKGT